MSGHASLKSKAANSSERGFTVAEKWVIWAVFCLLVGLSSTLLVFPAMLLLTYGVIILRRALKIKNATATLWLGIGALLTSAGLFWWAIVR